MDLTPYLKDLENRIDILEEERLENDWLQFADGLCREPFFSPKRKISKASVDYPAMYVNDAFENENWMVYHQLKMVNEELAGGKGNLLCVRPNYGTGIIPSMFGAEMFYLARELDTLPCTRTLADGEDGVRTILRENKMYFDAGLSAKVFRFAQHYHDAVAPYPKIRRCVHVYNPDLQGPFPLSDMLWGGDIYIAMYEDEALVHEMLSFMTDVYLRFTAKWHALYPPFDKGHSVEWGLLHRGGTMIRNDAAMNISGNMYHDFVMPYDRRIIDALGGGVHFCGRGDHYIEHVCAIENIGCINLSQPHLNDMEKIYSRSIDCGIPIIGMPEDEISRAVAQGRDLKGKVHSGASLAVWESKPKG
ncbi:MAG: hypothetical protein PHQ85_03480 [Eubacteriales bacterium]|jgi:hypothetical protein|nr:hypothetical protein [Eubacteriales bacterium]MDD4104840.1 hypothetical protein [Eubacteriales bacterium]MDD4710398.1 hypothetical protein [Eubacteriales bacterium]NLO16186.1 hypothetical protein [Clostridiales bacterium]